MIEIDKLQLLTGVMGMREVSANTTVVEYPNSTRPATKLETQLWQLLLTDSIYK
jgi:hypothetical protein